MRFSDLSARFNSRLDLQKNVIAMRFGDDEAMIMSNDEKSGLLEVKLMPLAAFCCLHHIFATFLHRERCETMFDDFTSYY
mgnify:CR=1 FL=1